MGVPRILWGILWSNLLCKLARGAAVTDLQVVVKEFVSQGNNFPINEGLGIWWIVQFFLIALFLLSRLLLITSKGRHNQNIREDFEKWLFMKIDPQNNSVMYYKIKQDCK